MEAGLLLCRLVENPKVLWGKEPEMTLTQTCSSVDRSLEEAILELLDQRAPGKTICPSDAARRVAPEAWRPLMEQTRAAAGRLVASGKIVVTQQGQVVDLSRAKGAIRLRKA
jgi:hypothetical protein